MSLIAALGLISGAHLNPAVSFADAIRGGLPWREVPAYWLGQIVGAVTGVATANTMFGLPAFFILSGMKEPGRSCGLLSLLLPSVCLR